MAETRQYSTQLEAVFENNKKENEILELRTAELNKTLSIKKSNNLYLAGALLLFTAVFFILTVRSKSIKQQLLVQEKELQQEKISSLEKEQQVLSL